MSRRRQPAFTARERGVALLEVLVAILILVVGLFGVAGLHSRMTLAESESFQRAQAIVLMRDMVSRITANRKNAMSYATATPVGTGQPVGNCTAAGMTVAARDLCEWNNALLGASESLAGSKVGAMLGARGCVDVVSATMPRQFRVSVVWQGTAPTVIPGATACGAGSYGDDRTRRALTTLIEIGCLQNDPASLLCVSTF